jgi:hypothetical protein
MSQIPLEAPCPCASGKDYLHCCGHPDPRIWNENALGRTPGNLTDPQWAHVVANEPRWEYRGESLPPGVLVKDLDDRYEWRTLASSACQSFDTRAALTRDKDSVRKSVWRETEIVDPGEHSEQVLQLVRTLFRDEAEPFYGRRLHSLESPHILRYSVGSYYRPHADSDALNLDTSRWEKKLDRDLSLSI